MHKPAEYATLLPGYRYCITPTIPPRTNDEIARCHRHNSAHAVPHVIAVLEAHRAGLLTRAHWLRNIVAGLIVGVVALPLAMAFAIASGARPEQGIYTAIIAGALASLFGGSRFQISGPTGAFIAILAGITAQYGISGLQIAALMAGIMLVLMGLAKLGAVIKFIPLPVIAGFTTGIGVIIFIGQCRDFFGLPEVSGKYIHAKLWHLIQALPQVHWPTVGIALLSLVLVLATPRIKLLAKVPGPLIAMLIATALQAALNLPGVATIGSAFGGIPAGLPTLQMPSISLTQAISLLGPAFTIALLCAIESLLSAAVADGMADTRHDSNQELIGQGIANIATPLFGGFAATGAIARTSTNIRNGATSPVAGMAHAATLVAILLVLAPLAAHIPLAALAAILFVVSWQLADVNHFSYILRRAPMADRVILVITFLLTVFADLVVAVNAGVILAVLHFLRRMAETVETKPVDHRALSADLADLGLRELPQSIMAYEIAGPMFFGAVEQFEHALKRTHTFPQVLILRLDRVPQIDMTGIQTLDAVIIDLKRQRVRVLLCEANQRVLAELRNATLLTSNEDYFATLKDALSQALAFTAQPEPPR